MDTHRHVRLSQSSVAAVVRSGAIPEMSGRARTPANGPDYTAARTCKNVQYCPDPSTCIPPGVSNNPTARNGVGTRLCTLRTHTSRLHMLHYARTQQSASDPGREHRARTRNAHAALKYLDSSDCIPLFTCTWCAGM